MAATRQQLLRYFERARKRVVAFDELCRKFGRSRKDRANLERRLKDLQENGQLIELEEHRFGLPRRLNMVVGTLDLHLKGFGFVIPLDGKGDDLYIGRQRLASAMDGDTVVARIVESIKKGKRRGIIVQVLRRARTHIIGKYCRSRTASCVVPYREKMVPVDIPRSKKNAKYNGAVVEVEITDYGNRARAPIGRISAKIGYPDDRGVDAEIILRKYQFAQDFPEEVLDEATILSTTIDSGEITKRRDLRSLSIVTIDGETAKDFDDAVSIEELQGGNYRLGVHIADVAHYVEKGSALDREAEQRGTSVYLPSRVVPMLPPRLSNNLCSLKPKTDRLSLSVIMEVDSAGHVVKQELCRSVIQSQERLTYTVVEKLLQSPTPSLEKRYAAILDDLRSMKKLCEILREKRMRRGSIDFDLPEADLILDRQGDVADIMPIPRLLSHRIIEEFMVLANETVASFIQSTGHGALFRVHEAPDPTKISAFRDFLSRVGYALGGNDSPQPRHFQALLETIEGRPEEMVIAHLMLRSMKKALYSPHNLGHFGLASSAYTHFTSPIRRYPDLIVHRILKTLLDKRASPYSVELSALARHASERERAADEAERELVEWKTVRFLRNRVGETFTGYITGVVKFGFFVELRRYLIEGLVHLNSLDDDYYRLDEPAHCLIGQNTGKRLRLGDEVTVRLASVDEERSELDFELVALKERD